MSVQQVALRIMDSVREPTLVLLDVRELTASERVKRGLLRWAAMLAVTLLCLFVPIAHFLLTPLALLSSPVFAWFAWRKQVIAVATEVRCPKCGELTPIEPNTVVWPLPLHCARCGTSFSALLP